MWRKLTCTELSRVPSTVNLVLCCLLFLGGLGVVKGGWSGGSGGVKFSVRKAIAFKLKHKLAGLSFILG